MEASEENEPIPVPPHTLPTPSWEDGLRAPAVEVGAEEKVARELPAGP